MSKLRFYLVMPLGLVAMLSLGSARKERTGRARTASS